MQTQPVRPLVAPDPQSAPVMLRNTPPLTQEETGCYVSCCPRRHGEAQSDEEFRWPASTIVDFIRPTGLRTFLRGLDRYSYSIGPLPHVDKSPFYWAVLGQVAVRNWSLV